jgi:ketosteroid isomerase-like protein
MPRIIRLAAWVSASWVLVAFGVLNAQQPNKDEQALVQLERDWCAAAVKGDAASFRRILADDYAAVSSRGVKRNKAQELAELKASPTTACNDTNIQVRLYGDAALVTGEGTRSGTYQGKPFKDRRFLWSDFFVRRNGQWQAVASPSTLVEAQQR